jgi:hypothetical protein
MFVELGSGENAAFINIGETEAVFPYDGGSRVNMRQGSTLLFPDVPFNELILQIELSEIEATRDEEL